MSFLAELRRRNVLRVGAAYIVTAWLVVQVVETLFPIYGLSDAAVRIVVNIVAVGLVPVLVLSWVFEWTPEGLKKDRDVVPGAPASAQAAKRLDRAILVVLALAVGYFAFDRFVLVPQQMAEQIRKAHEAGRSEALVESFGDHSIAVLAFDDLSPEGDQEYLSDGIAEELLNLLARIPELRVISRSSAFHFKSTDIPVPEIARQLNVAHVLEGSVRKSGDRIRITAQLIEARSDTHLWSDTYDRKLVDVFAIQDEIASAMVEQLKITLLDELPHSEQINPSAYALYLEGRHLIQSRGGVITARRGIELLEQAVAIEPAYADAWVEMGLGYAQLLRFEEGQTEGRTRELDRLWFRGLSKALEIDSDHPAANAYLAWDTMLVNGDYINAAEQFERALGIDPYDWEVLRGNILFASIIGRTDIADVLGRIAITRNPLCGPCHRHVSRSLFRAGLFDLAEISLLNVMDLLPPGRSTTELALIRYMKGDHDGLQRVASDYLARARPEDQDIAIVRHIELLGAVLRGETGGLQVEIDEFAHRWGDRHLRSCAELYAETGQLDKAFELFERGYGTQYNSDLAAGLMNPLFRKMTEDPRWKAWQEKAGIAPHQLAVIEYQPNLPPAEGLVKLKPGDLASE